MSKHKLENSSIEIIEKIKRETIETLTMSAKFFMSYEMVCRFLSLSRSAIYFIQRDDPTFPKAYPIYGKKRMFKRSEIEAWAESKVQEQAALMSRDGAGANVSTEAPAAAL